MRVVMIGADRSVHGGVSAVVNNYYKAGLDKKVTLTYIGTMVDGSRIRKLLRAIRAYLYFLTRLPGMDILHVNMAADASFYRKRIFIETAACFKKKIVIHEHGGDFQTFYYEKSGPSKQKKIKKTLNKADVFVVLSRQWADFFTPLVENEKIVILENAVPIPVKGKEDYNNRNLLFLGRLCKEKGIGELLDVLPEVAASFPDVKLYLGGIWADAPLKEKAEQSGPAVEYLGWLGEAEKQRYMKKCSIFVLPTYFEGQPVSLLEAMAEGMAILTTEVGGIPQMLQNETNALLIPPKSQESLAEGLKKLLSDEELRRRYGEEARKRAVEQYDIVRSVDKLCALYNRMTM